ncbi:MAG TPA: DUF1501 domain-containing protein [Steroidobacteraceae bacterium]|jgi:uncharacterized protein (DUF1501 family)|nr:DUF1501 domain-containing protein [Steroidobacteraceae bacterium]
MKRREFLTAGALAAGGVLLSSQVTFAGMANGRKPRLVFVILRGALDGLAAVPACGDPGYAQLRGDLALGRPGSAGGALPLDGFFALHPSLSFMQQSYAARELIVFHAVASAYRDRSHFDGQNVLETGYPQPHAVETGWLNRALAAMPAAAAAEKERGISIAPTAPLVMRGPAAVTSWSPSHLAPLDDDTLQRISDLYSHDPVLGQKLAEALAAEAIADARMAGAADASATMGGPMMNGQADGDATVEHGGNQRPLLAKRGKPGAQYSEVVAAAARFLRREDGPQVAVFDTLGWDTHFNEGGAKGQLAVRLTALDGALGALKAGLGPVWSDTAVLLATEFGRTVAENGTRGTDHGTATAAYLVGGAVQGGRVVADWPGLSPQKLYQDRDLRPTLDLRAVMKGLLAEHLDVPQRALESSVFPASAAARPLKGLLRA